MNAAVFFGGKNVVADGQVVGITVDKLEGEQLFFRTL
jgi:hypothetical protein